MTAAGRAVAGFEPVRSAFEANLASDDERGACFAVVRDGELLVDLWGGDADAAGRRPWQADTLANVWSTTKGMGALCCAMLVDRGRLDYEAPVASVWPEFRGRGKHAVTVGMLLSHQAGLTAPRQRVRNEDFYDAAKINAMLLEMEPLWEPGTASGYHALTFGPLVGELVERADGRSVGRFFREEVATPLGVDFHIGLPESEDARVAEMIPPRVVAGRSDSADLGEIARHVLGNPAAGASLPNSRAWRAAEIVSANGQGNARALAQVYGVLAAGGDPLLSAPALAAATKERIQGRDLVLSLPIHWGAGFILNGQRELYGPNAEAFGHSGWGGSFAFADPIAGLGVGYVMNKMAPNLAGDPRALRLLGALYECL